MSRRPISFIRVIFAVFSSFALLFSVSPSWAINNAPADAAVVNLRTNCTEGGIEVTNCFTTMAAVDNWLLNVRQAGPTKPTLVEIGPGSFGKWICSSDNVTLRGAGRDRTELVEAGGGDAGLTVNCTNLNVQDMTLNGRQAAIYGGVRVTKRDAITTWTNVEIVGSRYAWTEGDNVGCPSREGRHSFFSSRITSVGGGVGFASIAYWAACASSWFWGSEITANVVPGSENRTHTLVADEAEIHLYGSNARLIVPSGLTVQPTPPGLTGTNEPTGSYLMAALKGSAVHIHGTGLDVIHAGSGTADMLYADSISHYHANESGFNIHVTGSGKVNRVVGLGSVETPYMWGAGIVPPLSTSSSGVQTLTSRNGMDSYIETDCPLSTNQDCSAGASLAAGSQYPRLMVYRKECTGTGANQGPWFDTVRRACRN